MVEVQMCQRVGCGIDITLERDHTLPESAIKILKLGNPNAQANIWSLCRPCHFEKTCDVDGRILIYVNLFRNRLGKYLEVDRDEIVGWVERAHSWPGMDISHLAAAMFEYRGYRAILKIVYQDAYEDLWMLFSKFSPKKIGPRQVIGVFAPIAAAVCLKHGLDRKQTLIFWESLMHVLASCFPGWEYVKNHGPRPHNN